MSYLKIHLTTHSQKVCSLYKRALRNNESWSTSRHQYRYNACLIRERFEKNRNIKDMRTAKELLELGEEELFQHSHYQPMKFPTSPGGSAYERYTVTPDWVVDFWDPAEKAQYPDYFARREERKKEYVANWEKKYGKPRHDEHHH